MVQTLRLEIKTLREELESIPKPCNTYEDCVPALIAIATNVATSLGGLVKGAETTISPRSPEEDVKPFNICPRALEIMESVASNLRGAMPDFLSEAMARTLEEELREYRGVSLPNLLGSAAVKKIIEGSLKDSLPSHCMVLTQQVSELLGKTVVRLVEDKSDQYPRLVEEMRSLVLEYLEDRKRETDTFLAKVSIMYTRQIVTLDHYYLDTINKARKASTEDANSVDDIPKQFLERFVQLMAQDKDTDKKDVSNESQAIWDYQLSLYAYNKVVLKAFIDTIWKSTRELLLDGFYETLTPTIIKRLTGSANVHKLIHLMQEDEEVLRVRERKTERLDRFTKHLPKLEAVLYK